MEIKSAKDKAKRKTIKMILYGEPGVGKCFGKGTKVLMFDGSIKNVEDVVVGDRLMGDDSTPRNVLGLGRGKEMMYKVSHRDKSYYVVNKSHILTLQRTGDAKSRIENGKKYPRKNRIGEVINVSVMDYLSKSNKFYHRYKGYKTFVDWEKKGVDIDPYILGLWLGDGNSDGPSIESADKCIVEALEIYAKQNNWKVTCREQIGSQSNSYSIVKVSGGRYGDCFKSRLEKYGLLKNKHIPEDFKINDTGSRLKLLAGLIDTDGWSEGNNKVCITQKNRVLAEDIMFLARSLGFYSSIWDKNVNDSVYWTVYISGKVEDIPVLLKRKVKSSIHRVDSLRQAIEIEPISIDNYYGFEIDGNKLFVLADFTVVHNTTFCATAPKPLFIDLEGGLLSILGEGFDAGYIEAKSIDDVIEVFKLASEGQLDQYETIVIDSLTEAMKRLQDVYRKQDGRLTLQDWGFIIQRTEEMVRKFRDLKQHVIFTALTQEVETEDGLYKRPSLSGKKLPEDVTGYVDIVGYMIAYEENNVIQRRIAVQPRQRYYAKDRSGALPSVIEPDFKKMWDMVCGKKGWTEVIKEQVDKVLNNKKKEVKNEKESAKNEKSKGSKA